MSWSSFGLGGVEVVLTFRFAFQDETLKRIASSFVESLGGIPSIIEGLSLGTKEGQKALSVLPGIDLDSHSNSGM